MNFAVFSENATKLELCLFNDAHDAQGTEDRIPMRAGTAHVWHLYVEGARPGQRYGFRASGPYDVARGHRFNPNKVLVDPYARALAGKVDYHAPVFGYAPTLPGEKTNDKRADARDDAWGVPRSVVVDDTFDWGNDRPPEVPWPDTVVYELQVKGFTRRHHDVPSEHRGTYLGVASDATVAHLQSIGVTTVELMPVHEVCDELFVAKKGLTNYWGYSTLGFFAPDQRLAAHPAASVREFKEMVKRLHAADIEVVLDVVYNHTCEGDRFGPTLSLRGLDNAVYYRLD
ncbi:MAG TPA: alpha-amylase family glycosyl hydrolase, partial [Polyangiaceae bacterium]